MNGESDLSGAAIDASDSRSPSSVDIGVVFVLFSVRKPLAKENINKSAQISF